MNLDGFGGYRPVTGRRGDGIGRLRWTQPVSNNRRVEAVSVSIDADMGVR